MRFNEFHASIYVIKEAVLAIASFFCPKMVSFPPSAQKGIINKGHIKLIIGRSTIIEE